MNDVKAIAVLPRTVPNAGARHWLVVDRLSGDGFEGFCIAERQDPDRMMSGDQEVVFSEDIAIELARVLARSTGTSARPPADGCVGAFTRTNLTHLMGLPRGWAILFVELLQRLPQGYEVDWVKEKLGSLRVSPIGEHSELLNEFTERSRRTCASCGAPGRMTVSEGFYLPHCSPCAGVEGFEDPPPRKPES